MYTYVLEQKLSPSALFFFVFFFLHRWPPPSRLSIKVSMARRSSSDMAVKRAVRRATIASWALAVPPRGRVLGGGAAMLVLARGRLLLTFHLDLALGPLGVTGGRGFFFDLAFGLMPRPGRFGGTLDFVFGLDDGGLRRLVVAESPPVGVFGGGGRVSTSTTATASASIGGGNCEGGRSASTLPVPPTIGGSGAGPRSTIEISGGGRPAASPVAITGSVCGGGRGK